MINAAFFAAANDGVAFDAARVNSGTITLNHVQTGSAMDTATVTNAGDVTIVAGTNVSDEINVTMAEGASTVVNAGAAAVITVVATDTDDTEETATLVLNGDISGSVDVATTVNITSTEASTLTITNIQEVATIAADALTSIDIADVADLNGATVTGCLLYTSPSPRDGLLSRMPSSA